MSTNQSTLGGAFNPAADYTLTGNVQINNLTSGSGGGATTVTTTGTQTLTNKTLTAPVVTTGTFASPVLTTPTLGVATATSVNKVAITAPATSATLTIADGKTATVNNSLTLAGTDSTTMTFPAASASILSGVGLYKVARGASNQAAASDTIVTGLSTVVAVCVSPVTQTVKQMWFSANIGDQSGSPAAGSFFRISKKPTAVNDVTPIASTDFTDNISVNWIAIGT